MFDFTYPRMHKGVVMLFDDYGWKSTPRERMAWMNFFQTKMKNRFISLQINL